MNRRNRNSQQGISLVVSLVLLVVATLVALASMRGVVLQNRMSGATHDRNLAFQAAEAALRDAETRATSASSASFPASGCNSSGYCKQPALADTPRWTDSAFTTWRQSTAAAPDGAPVPEAIIEDEGEGPSLANGCQFQIPRLPNCMTARYLISARSTAEGRASVLVQSHFAAP